MESHPEEYYHGEHKKQSHNTVFCLLGSEFLNLNVLSLGLLGIDIGMLEP